MLFPFKSLDDPFREIVNSAVPNNYHLNKKFNINVYYGSNATIYSYDMPLTVVSSSIVL